MFDPREEEIFSHKDIYGVRKLAASYSFGVSAEDGDVKITIDIFEGLENFDYTISHHIQVPDKGRYSSSRNTGKSITETLNLAVENLMYFYDNAIIEGHESSKDWFVANQNFRSID